VKISVRARLGFTLMEVAVAAVLVAMLAAVTAPYFVEFIDRQRAQTTADKLQAIGTGIANFAASVKTTTNVATSSTYPGKISELANVIVAASTVTHNSCGSGGGASNFNATAVTSWNSFGPFVTFMISPTATALQTPLGPISDSLIRAPLTTAGVGTISIRLLNVDVDDVATLDQIIDGSDGSTAGVLQWTTPAVAGVISQVRYILPIAARC
jgi:prepilin-type N-terminal cleavage/methylation domain-containing protein